MNDMKKILYIRRTPTTKIDGTVRYCDALHDMFANDDTLKACHIENYPTNKSLFFHYSYKKKPLADAIRQADRASLSAGQTLQEKNCIYRPLAPIQHVVASGCWQTVLQRFLAWLDTSLCRQCGVHQ